MMTTLSPMQSPSYRPDPRKWFAVVTTPQHEKAAFRHLDFAGIETFLPTYESSRTWKNRQKVKVELPLFPTYLSCVSIRQTGPVFCALLASGVWLVTVASLFVYPIAKSSFCAPAPCSKRPSLTPVSLQASAFVSRAVRCKAWKAGSSARAVDGASSSQSSSFTTI